MRTASAIVISMGRALPWILLLVYALSLFGAEPISDEAVRQEVLQAIFPGAAISVIPGRTLNRAFDVKIHGRRDALFYPDAFAKETVYRVLGWPVGEERCAAQSVVTMKFSKRRDVRLQAYPWRAAVSPETDLLAIVQYDFPGAQGPLVCQSFASIFHVRKEARQWHVRANRLLDTTHHNAIQSVQLLDLAGDGQSQLVIESDSGGGGGHESNLHVFSLSQGGFQEWLHVYSRFSFWIGKDEQYRQTLDVSRTVRERARHFCFSMTTYARDNDWFARPHISRPCYSRFTDVLDGGRPVDSKARVPSIPKE